MYKVSCFNRCNFLHFNSISENISTDLTIIGKVYCTWKKTYISQDLLSIPHFNNFNRLMGNPSASSQPF